LIVQSLPPAVGGDVGLCDSGGLSRGVREFREYLNYRYFRDNTIPVEATISGISKK
jgi:hypothetical protein